MRLRPIQPLSVAAVVLALAAPLRAAPPDSEALLEPDRFLRGQVVEVIGEREAGAIGEEHFVQTVRVG